VEGWRRAKEEKRVQRVVAQPQRKEQEAKGQKLFIPDLSHDTNHAVCYDVPNYYSYH
jgi:hypothetical protein